MRYRFRFWHLSLLLLPALLLASGGFYTTWADLDRQDRAMLAKCAAIQPGMSREEVEELMGREYDEFYNTSMGSARMTFFARPMMRWDGPGTLMVDVALDEQRAAVVDRWCHKTADYTVWDRIRWRIRDPFNW